MRFCLIWYPFIAASLMIAIGRDDGTIPINDIKQNNLVAFLTNHVRAVTSKSMIYSFQLEEIHIWNVEKEQTKVRL